MARICATGILLLLSITGFGQWTTNTFDNLRVSTLEASDIQTATTSDGKTWIAWYSNNGGNYDMRAQLLDAGGNRLLGPDGVLVSAQPSGTATFVFNVCADRNDALIIGFQYEVGGNLNAVVSKVNTDGSLPWGDGVILGEGLAPYPATNADNETVVAWNNNSPSTLYLQKISAAGALMWAAPVPVKVGTSNTTRGQVVTHGNGYFTVVFQRKSFGISTTLYARRYDGSGNPQWSGPVQLCDQTTSGARYYSVKGSGELTYCGYYASGGSRFFSYLQKINPDGSLPWGINGSPFTTYASGNDPMPMTTGIALNENAPNIWAVAAFSDPSQNQYGVYVQKFDTATGSVLLNPTGKEVYPVSASRDTYEGGLSLADNDPMFISYDVDYKIYATRLNTNGDFIWPGNRVELSSTTYSLANPKGRFAFTEVKNNLAVAVWQENRTGTDFAYAQHIYASGVLPVSIIRFSGLRNGSRNELQWTTSCENGCAGFEVQRSADGYRFQTLQRVNSLAPAGTSSTATDYMFTDEQPGSARWFYRLRQFDASGTSRYSATIRIEGKDFGTKDLTVYPNPAINEIRVATNGAPGILRITDLNGKRLMQQPVSNGNTSPALSIGSLPSGRYIIEFFSSENMIGRSGFIKN